MFKLARTISFCFIVVMFFCISLLGHAEENIETLIFYDDFPPFSYLENGQTKGLYVDLVSAVFDDMGVAYNKKTYPFKRALLYADKGAGILVGILKNQERQKKYDYSSLFYIERSMLFVKQGQIFPFRLVGDLNGKSIGVKLGWSYGVEFDQAVSDKLITPVIGEVKQLYTLLKAGRLDAVIGNELSTQGLLKQMNLQVELEALPTPLLLAEMYIAVKKGTKSALIEKFNIHTTIIKTNGVYEKILNEYGQSVQKNKK